MPQSSFTRSFYLFPSTPLVLILRLALFPPLAVHIHLILWLENRPDLAEQVPPFFRVIFTSFPCTVEEVFYSCLPFSFFLPSYKPTRLTHPLPCTPPPSILLRAWQKPTLPCLPASAPLILHTSPAHGGRRGGEREKERAAFVHRRLLQTAT